MLGWVTSENDVGGGVKLPGQPELETRQARISDGIPIDAGTFEQFEQAAESVGVARLADA